MDMDVIILTNLQGRRVSCIEVGEILSQDVSNILVLDI